MGKKPALLYLVQPSLEFAQELRVVHQLDIQTRDYQLFSPNYFILGHFILWGEKYTPNPERLFFNNSRELRAEYQHALNTDQLEIILDSDSKEFRQFKGLLDAYLRFLPDLTPAFRPLYERLGFA